jgi:DnaJ-class molecular chaperone
MNKWHICPICEGEGSHSHHLGALTSSDLEDWSQEDLDCLMNGGYDRTCATCEGSGKVREDQLESVQPVRYYATDEEYFRNREGGY